MFRDLFQKQCKFKKFWQFKRFVMQTDEIKCCILDIPCFEMSVV